jgi:thermitase
MKHLSILLSLILILSFLTTPAFTYSTSSFIENLNINNDSGKSVISTSDTTKTYLSASAKDVLTEIPDDTYFDRQWELQKIQAPQAWNTTHASKSIIIAILDSGIDSSHEDLASKIVAEINFSDSSTTQDVYIHGTAIAGIAAAIANNDLGIAGVGYDASLMNVKVLGDKGSGSYSWIIDGIIWATDNGANIINLSMDGGVDSPELKKAVDYAWDRGVLIVVASGNGGSNIDTFPAGYEHCLAVAATDRNDQRCAYSNYGDWVDVAAPGEAYSTLTTNKYGNMSGTSISAPYVSGLAALAFSIARDTNGNGKLNDEVRAAIENNCDRISDPGTGKGRINAQKTLASLLSDQLY